MNTNEMEGQRLRRLTDNQILEALTARCGELDKARMLDFCCRMFDKAAESNPDLAPGLHVARGLVEIYGRNMAAGSDQNPFKKIDANASVASVIAAGMAKYKSPTKFTRVYVEEPVKPADEVKPWVDEERNEFGAENHLQPPKPRETKVGRISAIIMSQNPDYAFGKSFICHRKPEGCTDQDVANALAKLQREGKIAKFGKHLWSVVQQPQPAA